MPRRKTKEQFVSQCRELWGDRFNYDKVEYVNQRTEVVIYCNVHKRYFTQQPFFPPNNEALWLPRLYIRSNTSKT